MRRTATLTVFNHLLFLAEEVPDSAAGVVAVVRLVYLEKSPRVSKTKFLPQSVISINELSTFY